MQVWKSFSEKRLLYKKTDFFAVNEKYDKNLL